MGSRNFFEEGQPCFGDCGWPASRSRAHCRSCHRTFSRDSVFDMHRRGSFRDGSRRCLTLAEMTKKGLHLGKDAIWYGPGVRGNPTMPLEGHASSHRAPWKADPLP